MLKQQARSALEGYFDVTLTQLAERHPFTYAGVNEEVIHLDLAILSHAHGLSGVTLKHCILVSNQGPSLRYEFFTNLAQARLPILPHHPLGMMMPVVSVPVASLQEIPA
ncbi:hypothetical protein ACSZNT_06200 [Aeromonas veronii]|uniref:hypothetical protein n=1 Tax=Aeromonas TaxID=642 RepID=UPI00084B5BE4|nr:MULTISPECIES: hypothetical protein [Aeromonas]NJI33767.1 hypothetical protein [Aeromonas veronii]OEC41945.1 hypothetical protein A9G06_19870 [Aeromonas sp. DNP9]